jgi:hypothetical protein
MGPASSFVVYRIFVKSRFIASRLDCIWSKGLRHHCGRKTLKLVKSLNQGQYPLLTLYFVDVLFIFILTLTNCCGNPNTSWPSNKPLGFPIKSDTFYTTYIIYTSIRLFKMNQKIFKPIKPMYKRYNHCIVSSSIWSQVSSHIYQNKERLSIIKSVQGKSQQNTTNLLTDLQSFAYKVRHIFKQSV